MSSFLSLNGQIALVTGAATGIGAAIAGRLAGAGATVFIADVDEEAAARAALAITRAGGGQAVPLALDVTNRQSVERAVVHFLASEDCSFVTGQCYDGSGGRATY